MLTRSLYIYSKQSAKVAAAAASSNLVPSRSTHSLPQLPYDYKALEPVISGDIMEVHYCKHHATYVSNLNVAEEQLKQCAQGGTDTAPTLTTPTLHTHTHTHTHYCMCILAYFILVQLFLF